MKKLVLVFALVAMSLAGSVFAQGEYTNNIGVYLDELGWNRCCMNAGGEIVPAYLILSNLTLPAVDSLEFKLLVSGGGFLTDLSFRGQHIDAGPGTGRPGEHIVGWVTPFPNNGDPIVVGDLSFLITDKYTPFHFMIHPVLFSSLSPGPGYPGPPVVGFEGQLEAGHPSLAYMDSPWAGTYDDPVFTVNGICDVIATEVDTWGDVKSLYR